MAERSRRTGVNQDRVVLELAKIAFVRMTDVVDSNGIKSTISSILNSIKSTFKKTFADVPDRIKDKVKEVLVYLDCPELAE